MLDVTRMQTAVAMIWSSEYMTFTDSLDLLALLDVVEEHLRRVAGGQGTPKQGVVVEQRHHVRFAK